MEKFARRNSTQVLAAYVVIYGVNCRCRKQNLDNHSTEHSDPLDVNFSLDVVKYEVEDIVDIVKYEDK